MNQGAIVGVATRVQEVMGFWGYGTPAALTEQLAALLSRTERDDWHIVPSPAPDGTWVTVSIGGLVTQPDAWVRTVDQYLMLGRQAFGRAPLYWTRVGQIIWFASRCQWLLSLVSAPTVSLPALYGYSCFSYVPTPLTPIEAIAAIPAGTEYVWQDDGSGTLTAPRSQRLLEWCEEPEVLHHEQEVVAQLQTLLKAAVERQIADLQGKTVGVFLSGGLDSSTVAALLVQAGVTVRAYTLDFGDSGIPEHPYAEQVAQWLQIPLTKVRATPRQLQPALVPTIRALDLPFGDGVTVPLYLLNRAASRDVDVVFNGEGGDQLFAGWTNKPLIAASIYHTEHPNGGESFGDRYLRTFHRLWGYADRVFQPAVYAQIQHLQPQDWLHPALDPTHARSLLHRLRRASLMLKGAQNIHPRATNLAAAWGLQLRSPFCDLPLAQWTFRLSGQLCLQGACEKYILKRAVEPWLPPEIVWRQKRGMGVPLTTWCLDPWWRSLGTWLNPGVLQAEGRWQPDLAARIAFGQLGGTIQGRRIGEILWLLVVWQFWRSQVLGEPLTEANWLHPFWLPYPFWRFCKRWF